MNFSKKIGLGLAAGMLASGLAMSAQAGVVAYSTLQITDFQITSGGEQITTPIAISNAASDRASFDGGAGVTHSDSTGAIDPAMACVGDCGGIGQNDFSQVSAGDPTIHFARGDALLTGSLLAPGGASAYSVGEIQLTHTQGGANAGGEVSTASTFWTVDVDSISDITLEFDAFGELLTASDEPAGFAQADFDWTFTLQLCANNTGACAGSTVFEASPDELNQGIAVFGLGSDSYTVSDHFVLTVTGLLADRRYRVIISHNTDVEASLIPEPVSMAVLGFGLLGLGGLAVRRRKSA